MLQDRISKSYSWKTEADLTDHYRLSIIHVAEQSIAEFDKTEEARHYREELAWMLQLFTAHTTKLSPRILPLARQLIRAPPITSSLCLAL